MAWFFLKWKADIITLKMKKKYKSIVKEAIEAYSKGSDCFIDMKASASFLDEILFLLEYQLKIL